MVRGASSSWVVAAVSTAVVVSALALDIAIGGPIVLLWSTICTALILGASFKTADLAARRSFRRLATIGFLMVAGIVVREIHGAAIGVDSPIPSWADLIHIPAYVLFAGAILSAHRQRSTAQDTDAWLDSLIIVIGFAVVIWSAFLGDFLLDGTVALETRLINQTYTTLNLISFAIALRVMASPGVRPISYYLLAGACFSFVVADVVGSYSLATGDGVILATLFSPMVFGLTAAAVLHPSSEGLFRSTSDAEPRVTRIRLAGLVFALLTPVASLFVLTSPDRGIRFGILLLAAALSICLAARLGRLLAFLQQNIDLERRLTKQLASLTTRTDSAAIHRQLPRQAEELVHHASTFRFTQLMDAPGDVLETVPLTEPSTSELPSYLVAVPDLNPRNRRAVERLAREARQAMTQAELSQQRSKAAADAQTQLALSANERRFRALVQNASDLVLVVDEDGLVTYMSEASERVLGYPASEFEGHNVEWVVHGNDFEFATERVMAVLDESTETATMEVRAKHANGSFRLFDCLLTDMSHVDGVEGVVINATDVTDKRNLERDLLNAATTDPLTLMLNRHAYIEEVGLAVRRASVADASVAVAIINIDDFRHINEGLGPALADQVLIEVAHAVRRSIRMGDSLARLSGDEFAVLMPANYTSAEAVAAVERIIEEIAEPLDIGNKELRLRATAGIVLESDPDARGESLLRKADTALERAKSVARGKAVLYEDSMGAAASERIEIRNSLDTAIRNNEMRLVYQPIVDIDTEQIVSMEALARWEHPVRGAIGPAVFVPIAESSGYIHTLGEWALETTCQQVVEWEKQGLDGFTVSVNMSGHQLRREDIIPTIRRIVKSSGVDPSRIIIEITESVLIDDTDFIAARVRAIREMGLKLAIDDFGTGYSSLSYLQRYEFDVLKIDRSFVVNLRSEENSRRSEIVRSIISLADGLGAITVAEGVEEVDEQQKLAELGCRTAQGFLFHYPLELETVAETVNESRMAGMQTRRAA